MLFKDLKVGEYFTSPKHLVTFWKVKHHLPSCCTPEYNAIYVEKNINQYILFQDNEEVERTNIPTEQQIVEQEKDGKYPQAKTPMTLIQSHKNIGGGTFG